MSTLPLDHVDPFAATLGVMLYPGLDSENRAKARAFTSQFLATPLHRYLKAGGSIDEQHLVELATSSGQHLHDLEKCWWGGLTLGETMRVYFILSQKHRHLANWENAIRVVEQSATRERKAGSRANISGAKQRFLTVGHLWAAWCARGRALNSKDAFGGDAVLAFHAFLAESEVYREWGQHWKQKWKKKGKESPTPLPKDGVWRVTDEWLDTEEENGYSKYRRAADVDLPADFLEGLKPVKGLAPL